MQAPNASSHVQPACSPGAPQHVRTRLISSNRGVHGSHHWPLGMRHTCIGRTLGTIHAVLDMGGTYVTYDF